MNIIEKHIQVSDKSEPVAVMELYESGWDLVEDIDTDWLETLPFGTKLYTTPQQPSTVVRKPLTDARLDDIYYCVEGGSNSLETWREQARAIEAAHGIKE